MELYDKLLKPITEVNYLRAENVDRYRIIIRYFIRSMKKYITGCLKRIFMT